MPLRVTRRTGLVIPVPVAEFVADFRLRHDAVAVARRIHITVPFPFRNAAAVDEGHHAELTAHFANLEGFEAELTGVGLFAGYVWLIPEPRDRFVGLISATCARLSEYPPYDGDDRDPEPQLTIAAIACDDDVERVAGRARLELAAGLPFRFVVDTVALLEECADGTRQESARFGLA